MLRQPCCTYVDYGPGMWGEDGVLVLGIAEAQAVRLLSIRSDCEGQSCVVVLDSWST